MPRIDALQPRGRCDAIPAHRRIPNVAAASAESEVIVSVVGVRMNCQTSLFTVTSLGSSLLIAAAALSGCAPPLPAAPDPEPPRRGEAAAPLSPQPHDGRSTGSQGGQTASHDG